MTYYANGPWDEQQEGLEDITACCRPSVTSPRSWITTRTKRHSRKEGRQMNRPCGWAKTTRSVLRPPGGRTRRYRMTISTTSLTTTTPKAQAALRQPLSQPTIFALRSGWQGE